MDKASTSKIVLMSIHPSFVNAIMSGTKKVEFRKTKFASEVSDVVVYATSPMKQVVCTFEVKKIIIDSPDSLWLSYSSIAGVCREKFFAYYKSSTYGVAIEVGQLRKLKRYLFLPELGHKINPPQSYQYLDRKVFEQLV
ncbi:MAG: ASCH domain-containing protein [Elainellaceae cyanobacterium]